MRRILRSLLLALPMLSCVLVAPVRAGESFVVGVNANDRPFCWHNERGELTGFSVDIARALCKSMNAECRFAPVAFADFIPGILEKRFDFVVANVLRTPEREKLVDFTQRFWRSSSMFVGKPGALAEVTAQTLKGKTVAVQKGAVQEKYLREQFPEGVTLLTFATNAERNAALAAGKADLIFGSTVSHFAFLSTREGARFDFIGAPIDGQGLGGDVAIPLAKGRDELKQRLNAAIAGILRDGTFARINNSYFTASVF